MKSIIQFSITKDGDHYIASGVGHPIITEANTLDELQKNIMEAVELYLEDENLEELGLLEHPSLLMNIEIPRIQYA